MKKIFVFILLSVTVGMFLFSQEYDVRKLKWGMSFEELQKAEDLKTDFFKDEDIFGIKVETLFGIDLKGLYSVSYSTQDKNFAVEVLKVLRKKYGEPKTDLDYSFLMKVKDILKRFPRLIVQIYEKGNFNVLETELSPELSLNDRKIIRAGLSKRSMWEYGNTVVFLLNSPEGIVLSYWHKPYFLDNKKKFIDFMAELKLKAKDEEVKKPEDTQQGIEKF